MEDKGNQRPGVRMQWFRLVHETEGYVAFIHPGNIKSVVVDPGGDVIIYGGMMTATRGANAELIDAAITLTGDEAIEFLDWMNRNCALELTGTWERRAP